MQRHPAFDLWLHDDQELAGLLGAAVTERATIHEWPLSCVQRVRTADGLRHIYKVQAPPTLEPEVYSRARSPLLVPVRMLPGQGTTAVLLMDEIDAPRLNDTGPGPVEAAGLAWRLVAEIAAIEGDPPTFADIRGEGRWAPYFARTVANLGTLIARGDFQATDTALVRDLERIATGRPVLDAVSGPAGFIHADLKAENVLVLPDGLRVLDWQRPLLGPRALDAATLLISLGIDPLEHLPLGVVQLYHLLLVSWFTASAMDWLAGASRFLDGFVARIGKQVRALPEV